jgi:hypothetical protein
MFHTPTPQQRPSRAQQQVVQAEHQQQQQQQQQFGVLAGQIQPHPQQHVHPMPSLESDINITPSLPPTPTHPNVAPLTESHQFGSMSNHYVQ